MSRLRQDRGLCLSGSSTVAQWTWSQLIPVKPWWRSSYCAVAPPRIPRTCSTKARNSAYVPPADLVMFTVGELAAGRFPLWLAVAGFAVIAVVGTTVLFVACRGSAGRVVARYGPRLGLSEARVRSVAAVAGTRGLAGVAVGRATPGLRTLVRTSKSRLPAWLVVTRSS